MKILEVIPSLNSGGAERFVVDLSNFLVQKNDVCLITLYELTGPDKFYLADLNKKVNVKSLNKKTGFDISLIRKIQKVISEFKPDVIHSHIRAFDYLFMLKFRNPKIKFVHTVHSDAEKEAGGSIDRIFRKIAFKANMIKAVTISPESDVSFRTFYKKPACLINNGRNVSHDLVISSHVKTEVDSFKQSVNTKVIVCLAHISPVKRQPILARVINRLNKEGHDIVLLLIGRKDNQSMVSEIEDLKSDCIHMLGERHNPLEYLKYAGYYSLVSEYEGLPISLIEAIGVSSIPICTPVGGITNIIHNKVNGFISKDISESSIYDSFKDLLRMSDDSIQAMRQKVSDSYRPFSMDVCGSKYIELFNE